MDDATKDRCFSFFVDDGRPSFWTAPVANAFRSVGLGTWKVKVQSPVPWMLNLPSC